MLSASPEPFAPFLEEVKPLLHDHWLELALDQERVPLDPQYDVYLERDRRGEMSVIALRDAGALVGYAVFFVAPGLHYKTCLTATMDIFWTRPEVRGAMGGVKLFRAAEAELKRRGVQRMFVGSKCHKDASFLFERLGYVEVERYYSCWLGDETRPNAE